MIKGIDISYANIILQKLQVGLSSLLFVRAMGKYANQKGHYV